VGRATRIKVAIGPVWVVFAVVLASWGMARIGRSSANCGSAFGWVTERTEARTAPTVAPPQAGVSELERLLAASGGSGRTELCLDRQRNRLLLIGALGAISLLLAVVAMGLVPDEGDEVDEEHLVHPAV
jgi:hypothetical protein